MTKKRGVISTLKNSEFEAEPQEKNIKLIRNLKNHPINKTWLDGSETKFEKYLQTILKYINYYEVSNAI